MSLRSLSRTLRKYAQATSGIALQDARIVAVSNAVSPSPSAPIAFAAALTTALGLTCGVTWAAAPNSTESTSTPSSPATATPTPASQNDGTAQWRVFTDLARDLARQGRHDEAEKYLRRAVEAARKGFGPQDPHVASACQNLAEVYRVQQRYDLAAPLYDEALGILAASFGPKDIRVAFALHNVAGFHLAQKDYDAAARYYEQALQVKLAAVGPGHMETSNTLFHLGEVRWAQGRRDDGVALMKQSLDALEQQTTSDAACARRRTRLAEMLLAQGAYNEAEPLLRKVLETSGAEGLAKAAASENLAKALQGQGRIDEARALLESSLDTRRQFGGGAHPATAAVLRKIADLELLSASAGGTKSSNSGRPAQLAHAQLKALEVATEAVDIASRAYQAALVAAGGGTANAPESSAVAGLFSKIWPSQQAAPSVPVRAARPDLAVLELAACLRCQSGAQCAVGSVNEALEGLERALQLLTVEWPEQGTAAQSSSRVKDMREKAVCQILAASLGLLQGANAKEETIAQLNRVSKDYNCLLENS